MMRKRPGVSPKRQQQAYLNTSKRYQRNLSLVFLFSFFLSSSFSSSFLCTSTVHCALPQPSLRVILSDGDGFVKHTFQTSQTQIIAEISLLSVRNTSQISAKALLPFHTKRLEDVCDEMGPELQWTRAASPCKCEIHLGWWHRMATRGSGEEGWVANWWSISGELGSQISLPALKMRWVDHGGSHLFTTTTIWPGILL